MSLRPVFSILLVWGAVLTLGAPTQAQECIADATALCLNDERFRIEIDWRTPEGESGSGHAVRLSDDTGYFWFFRESNVEVILKVLDGRKINGHFWVFLGALSNLEYTLTVTDTQTGDNRTYSNAPGRFASIGDTLAFPVEAGATTAAPAGPALCLDGMAGVYPCRNVDLLAFVPLTDLGADGPGDGVSDHWGWTDPATGREYVLVGLDSGTAIVDISRPTEPVLLGTLDGENALLRDIKTFGNHALVVADGAGEHGLQVFDLTRLRDASPPQMFSPDAVYDGFRRAHNLAINEETGFAYAVDTDTCGGGLHMVDIRNPLEPTFTGCFSQDGATHDAQCVVYRGADSAHRDREICFACNEDTLTIVDVTDKEAPNQVSRTSYEGIGFSHQGWLTADHRHFLLDDEADEFQNGHNTRTYLWDVSDLDAPFVAGTYTGPTSATDHNLYIHRGLVFEANYQAGLRILDLARIDEAQLEEVAFFDTVPDGNAVGGGGAWTAYPFFASGLVTVSTSSDGGQVTLEHQGLFVLRPDLAGLAQVRVPDQLSASLTDLDLELHWRDGSTGETGFRIWRSVDGELPVLHAEVGADRDRFVDRGLTPGTTYTYRVSAFGDELESQRSAPFPLTIPSEPAESSGLCIEDTFSVCLKRNRFRVEVAWRDPFSGRGSGQGTALHLSSDTGYFWFFNSNNVELVVKVLDGRGLNGHFWVFYGALSNVEYTITVTDTETGMRRFYFNPARRFASRGDIEAL